jgi:hypothetical protein
MARFLHGFFKGADRSHFRGSGTLRGAPRLSYARRPVRDNLRCRGDSMPDLTPLPPLPDEEALGGVADALAPLLGLPIEPDWRPSVVANLKATAAAARLFLEFPLPDELEPAPRFEA